MSVRSNFIVFPMMYCFLVATDIFVSKEERGKTIAAQYRFLEYSPQAAFLLRYCYIGIQCLMVFCWYDYLRIVKNFQSLGKYISSSYVIYVYVYI